MKRLFMIFTNLLLVTASSGFTACSPDDDPVLSGTVTPAPEPQPDPEPVPPTGNRLQLTIGSSSFTATFADNATARAFKALLPMSVSMDELNGNEKYYYLSGRLPSSPFNPGTIRTGDLMLYGSDCIVLFYETFRTSYSYTQIGRLDSTSGLSAAVGAGRVAVRFELVE